MKFSFQRFLNIYETDVGKNHEKSSRDANVKMEGCCTMDKIKNEFEKCYLNHHTLKSNRLVWDRQIMSYEEGHTRSRLLVVV